MPEYTRAFLTPLSTGVIRQIEIVPFILEEMVSTGMLKALSPVQKKAAISVLSL